MNKFLQAQLFAIHNENNGDGSDLPAADGGQQQETKPATSVLGAGAEQQNNAGGEGGGADGDDKPDYGQLPENEDGYKVELEGFDFDEFKADEANKGFIKAAHAHGITDKQMSFILTEYNSRAGELVEGAAALDSESCIATLKSEWGADTEKNMGLAYRAAVAAGMTAEQINDPSFGNNPAVVKLAAYFGAQLGEDTPPANTQPTSSEDRKSLMASDAYNDPKHPDHKRVYAKVQSLYEKEYS